MSIVACSTWVPRGAAKETPDKIELSPDDIQRLIANTEANLSELQDGGEDGEEGWEDIDSDDEDENNDEEQEEKEDDAMLEEEEQEDDEDLKQFNLDDYDNEGGNTFDGAAGLGSLMYHNENDDPYLTLKDDDEEVDDSNVKPTDNLIVVGRTEESLSHLEVYLWNEEEDSLFVHHDILLESFPIAVEWLNFDPGAEDNKGNMVALGSMKKHIEVWDLDVIDAPEPAFQLGGIDRSGKKKKRIGHTAEVLSLGWNAAQPNLLASGSADTTVRLWDMDQGKCLRTYTHHNNKVDNVVWNRSAPTVLMTGAQDHVAAVFDTRNPEAVAKWKFDADVEVMLWSPLEASIFYAGLSDGTVHCCDSRNPGSKLFTLAAHHLPISSMAISPEVEGLLVTGSPDQTLKIWDVRNHQASLVVSRDLQLGPLYTLNFCPNSPFTLAIGGHMGGLKVENLAAASSVRTHFQPRHEKAARHAEMLVKRKEAEAEARKAAGLPAEQDSDFDESDEEDWATILDELRISQAVSSKPKPQTKAKTKTKTKSKEDKGSGHAAAAASVLPASAVSVSEKQDKKKKKKKAKKKSDAKQ